MGAVDAELRTARALNEARVNVENKPPRKRLSPLSRKKKQPDPWELPGPKIKRTCDRGRVRRPREPLAGGLDVRSLLALRALRDFELDFLSFLERF